jgi:hypothetical protein
MRWGVAVVLLTACGAQVDGGPNNPPVDTPPPIDTPPPDDAPPPDAPRLCLGGDAHASVSDGSCIVRFNTVLSFANAEAACVQFGAHLATLDTAERDAVAKSLVGTVQTWTGLNDRAAEGSFVWVADGAPIGAFKNFATGEPNNAGNVFEEDCVIWSPGRPGWDDRPCDNNVVGATAPGEYPYLCLF